ncbi:MAG TPA: efflux RND transporter periplasmic adaptor subunit [Candidatus Paceibacterota bacterium]|nr:efflux RND transporter periplasmic adaptor subunit [Candidatus Paceibacterota bacterium]
MKKVKDIFIKNIKRKRIWIPLVIVLVVVALFVFKPDSNIKNTVTDIAKYTDLKQTVLATGQVISNTDLNLSFNTSGVVKSIKVKVGDKVKAGQVLATLDQSSVLASLTSARGALAAANARYKRTLEGATSEEINLAEVALEQTKLTQDILVKNAYKNLLNSTPQAVPEDTSSDYTAPVITGNYNLGKEGTIYMTLYYSSGGVAFSTKGLVESSGNANTVTPEPIGNTGLYITFPSDTRIDVTDWVIEIPNKKAPDYLTNYNAYQAALSQSESAINQKEAELSLKKAAARPSDIELAQADILSAQGQVEQATAAYNNTVITAPADGTITSIDIKTGELAQALKEVIILQDVSNIYLEANVNEANIANLSVGLPVDITYDAFGSDVIFKGNITKIDPSSTIISGVVNYKITASVEQADNLRPGMTANMTIKAKEKNHVITVPSRAVLTDTDGSKTIRVVTNPKTKKFVETPITTGLEGDGGVVEVTNGLKENEEFVVLIKTK